MPENLLGTNAVSILSIITGILVLVYPRVLNYIVGIYLILVGLMGFIS